jgi:PAP2 superfamily
MIRRARSDRSNVIWTARPPGGDPFWTPTPPAFTYPPLEPLAGTWRTWNISSGSQFRPPPPTTYGTSEFQAEMLEVYNTGISLTDDQRRLALFWADGAGTVTPPGHWNLIAIRLLKRKAMSTIKTAKLFSALNTAQADAIIACWDAKFAYWSLRPVTAIKRLVDASWLPLLPTPPFPSYISGHSATSGAASTVLGALFPAWRVDLSAMAAEAAVSRLYGGIHYRSDNEAGLQLGRKLGSVALRAYRIAR